MTNTIPDADALKPCPFCGNAPVFANVPGAPEVYCEDCGIPNVSGETIEDVYTEWNTRHAQPQAQGDDIKSILRNIFSFVAEEDFKENMVDESYRVLSPYLKPHGDDTAIIDERDLAEHAFSQAYYLITGKSPEWSNHFGYAEAIEEINDAQKLLRASVKPQTDCRAEFEKWVVGHNQAPIEWIGHSYANAYMAAQYEGFKAAWKASRGEGI